MFIFLNQNAATIIMRSIYMQCRNTYFTFLFLQQKLLFRKFPMDDIKEYLNR